MATPLGHCLAGATVGVAIGRGTTRARIGTAGLAGAVAGAAADLDFLPGLLVGDAGRFHHATSHTLLAALLVAAIAAMLVGMRERWPLVIGAGYATHLALDYLTLDDSAPHGIPLLWPLHSTAYQAVRPLFPNILHDGGDIVSLHNASAAALELAILGPLLAVAWLLAVRRPPASGPRPRGRVAP